MTDDCITNSHYSTDTCLLKRFGGCMFWAWEWEGLNPFTPKSDQLQISPSASPGILCHTVWRTWVFNSLLRWKMIIRLPILTTSLIDFSLKCWRNVLFKLGSWSVKHCPRLNAALQSRNTNKRRTKSNKRRNAYSNKYGSCCFVPLALRRRSERYRLFT